MREDTRSRVVRLLKLALPLAALALAGAIFLSPRPDVGPAIDFSGVRYDGEEGLRLLNPRFSGRTPDGEPVTLRADWALPDGPDPSSVLLGPLTGEVALHEGRRVTLAADGGELRPKDRRLRLEGRVRLELNALYALETGEVALDMNAETLRAAGPVRGTGPQGDIAADAMRAARREESHYVWFEGRVRVRIEPAQVQGGRSKDGD